jgi:hypothetical protein
MLFREIIAVYCENHTEHVNTLCGQNEEILMLQLVIRTVRRVEYVMKRVLQPD